MILYVLFFFNLLPLLLNAESTKAPMVHLPNGLIEGKVRSFEQGSLNVFLGIPYAEPPIGELRFRPPKQKSPWRGVLMAKKFGPICHQYVDIAQKALSPLPVLQEQDAASEDCLYLNVYTPSLETDNSLPVVIYIHGGSFSLGMGSVLDGEYIASSQNLVVVSFNYRLGAFGFLSTLDDAAPGNYGLLDQLAVLQWVKTNIAKFGGNPSHVTLWGDEAGASSISLHLVSPLSKGLFQSAIVHSGSALRAGFTDSNHRQRTKTMAEFVPPCKKTTEMSTDLMVNCLRQANVADILKVQLHFYRTLSDFSPCVDGYFLPALPETLFAEGKSHPVPLLTGFTSMEGFMLAKSRNPDYLTSNFHFRSCLSSIRDWVQISYPEHVNEVTEGLELHYFNGIRESDVEKLRSRYQEVVGDLQIVAPTLKLAYHHSGPTYLYSFSYQPSWSIGVDLIQGATHTDDRAFFHQLPFVYPGEYTDEEIEIANRMSSYLSKFISTGNPNSPSSDAIWEKTEKIQTNVLIINSEDSLSTAYREFHSKFWIDKIREIVKPKMSMSPKSEL